MNQQREQEALLVAQREQELLAQKQAAQEKEESPQSSDFRQLIGEICGTKVCEEQKKNMGDTMLELLEDCRQKELYCMHKDVEDLIESVLNSKLLSINLKSQRLDNEKQEVKNIVEQVPKHRTHITESLQNFKVIHMMSFISNTSQISSVIATAPVLPTEEHEYSPSMGTSILALLWKRNLTHDDKSHSNEDVSMENFKIYLNPLVNDKESISPKIDPFYFNVESNLLKSLLNRDTLINSSPKFDYLLKDFSGELTHINPIPPGIEEADFDLEEEIRLVKNLFDSHMEEIDLFLATDDLMPPGIENDDYDSEGDIHFLEELLSNDSLPLSENKSSNFDHHDDPSLPRPPPEPLDVDVFFEPDSGVLTTKVVKGIFEHYVLMPNILPTLLTFDPLYPVYDTLLLFSSKNEDKVFKPGILSYLLVSHQDKITFDFF
nr:hypothetical protein [Tanacetum cinerariifolium]